MKEIQELLKGSKAITVLTGAGVSTDSGIPDFKTTDNEWPYELTREEIISLPYFHRNPKHFWKVYREIFGSKFEAEFNSIHKWIADLEKTHSVTVATQNVDGLHQAAGSSNVIECHGSLKTTTCLKCRSFAPMEESLLAEDYPRCKTCRKPLKPSIALFMEGVFGMSEAREAIKESDLLLIMGTSLRVGPFNELPYIAIYWNKIPTVFVNNEAVGDAYDFTHNYIGSLSDFVAEVKV